MKKFYLIGISLLIVGVADAQRAGRTSTGKVQKSQSPIVADVPVEQRLLHNDPRTSKRTLIISTEPAPKADPAREAFAQRKSGRVKIETPKLN